MGSFVDKVIAMSWESIQARLLRRKTLAQIDQEYENQSAEALVRSLTLFDLTCFGIAAVIGAGAFTTSGRASFDGGPAISLLFVLTARGNPAQIYAAARARRDLFSS